MHLTITKDSKLIYSHIDNDDKLDVTKHAAGYLYTPCTIEDGVTLRNIFDIIRDNIDIFTIIHGSWLSDVVTEAYSELCDDEKGDNSEELEHILLSLYASKYTGKNTPNCTSQWDVGSLALYDVCGVGPVLEKDDENTNTKRGDRINYSLSFTPVNKIIDLPIIVSNDVVLTEYIMGDDELIKNNIATLDCCMPHFGDIINSLIYEFTFFGSPAEREKTADELKQTVKEIDNGTIELVEWSPDDGRL